MVSVWGPEGRRPFGKQRQRRKDNTKMDIQDVGWVGMEWIALDQKRYR
jgi:hypothetical protein